MPIKSAYLIFGRGLKTWPYRFVNPNHISTAHKKACQRAGAAKLYEKTRDPYLVIHHLRHHSLEMTMVYLKSLGYTVDDRIRATEW